MKFRMYLKTTVRFLKSQMLSNPHFHHGHPAIAIREKSYYNATSGGVAAADVALVETAPFRSRGRQQYVGNV